MLSYSQDCKPSIILTCYVLSNSASFSPFAARTQQMIKEQLGQADDRTQLPDEYIELEKRVDALKIVHQKLLQVTCVIFAPVTSHLSVS